MLKKIFVVMRYSVLSESSSKSWKIGDKNIDVYKENLFNFDRLDFHQKLFEEVALRSLKQSFAACDRDIDVELIVMTSTELPTPYKEKLYECSRSLGWVSVVEVAPQENFINKFGDVIFDKVKDCHDIVYATVRLDDDDALHSSFMMELSKYLKPEFSGMAVSFSNGYAGIYNGAQYTNFHQMNSINNAQGLSLVTRYTHDQGFLCEKVVYAIKASHSRTHWAVPVIADGRFPMYIRTVHEQGDYYSKDYESRIASHKKIDLDKVCEEFGGLV